MNSLALADCEFVVVEVYPTDFTILSAPDRIAEAGDLWADILDAKHDIRALIQSV